MSVRTKLQVIPWILGLCVIAGSIAGARLIAPGDADAPRGDAAPAPKKTNGPMTGGVVVLGTVDSETPPVQVGPPSIAGMAQVAKVLVVEGQDVSVGTPLVQFDDAIFRAKLRQAQAGLAAAKDDQVKAEAQKQIHAVQIDAQNLAIKNADADVKDAEAALQIGRDQFDRVLNADRSLSTNQPLSETEKQTRRRENLDLVKGEIAVNQLKSKAEAERKKLAGLALAPVDADIRQAAQKVVQMQATADEAQAAVDACLRKADVAGVVEQIAVGPGSTFGPSTRTPVLWLVPSGPRVVRAEVEAEFASKIADRSGTRVTIYDHTNFALTYSGTVKRVGTSFLPKRGAADTLSVNSTKVLECLIEVTDPAPAGKPPLRVGQPVRVSFP